MAPKPVARLRALALHVFVGGNPLSRASRRRSRNVQKVESRHFQLNRGQFQRTSRSLVFRWTLHCATGVGPDPRARTKTAFAEIEQQVKKHQEKLRKDYMWKRKRGRAAPKLAKFPPPTESLLSDVDVFCGDEASNASGKLDPMSFRHQKGARCRQSESDSAKGKAGREAVTFADRADDQWRKRA